MNAQNNSSESEYERIKKFHVESVQFLINIIKDDIKDQQLEIVIDMGCGEGNITALFNQTLRCNKIVAIDRNQCLIESAIAKNSFKNIEFLTQDIGLEWHKLRPELKRFKGKVSLIYSNYTFLWLKEKKENVVKNIHRLLSTDGRFYVFCTALDPMFNFARDKKTLIRNMVKRSSKRDQLKEWLTLLDRNHFKVTKIETQKVDYNLSTEIYQKIIQKIYSQLLNMFVMESSSETDIADNPDVLLRLSDEKITEIIDEESGQKMYKTSLSSILTCAVLCTPINSKK